MKNKNIVSVLGVLGMSSLLGLTSVSAQNAPAIPPAPPVLPEISEAEAKAISSYLFGYRNGQQLAQAGVYAEDIDNDGILKGFIAGLKGDKPDYEQEKLQAAMQAIGKTVQDRQAKAAEENLTKGKEFLEKNGKREEVTTTESGLQYEVLKKGTDEKYVSKSPDSEAGTTFMVNYRGTLIDGKEFDKSPEGSPVPMNITRVIPGFKEALATMTVGSKYKFFMPSSLAYGPNPAGPTITPNSTLIFELELLEIQYPKPVPTPPAGANTPPKPKASAVTPPVPVPTPPKPESKKETAE